MNSMKALLNECFTIKTTIHNKETIFEACSRILGHPKNASTGRTNSILWLHSEECDPKTILNLLASMSNLVFKCQSFFLFNSVGTFTSFLCLYWNGLLKTYAT